MEMIGFNNFCHLSNYSIKNNLVAAINVIKNTIFNLSVHESNCFSF